MLTLVCTALHICFIKAFPGEDAAPPGTKRPTHVSTLYPGHMLLPHFPLHPGHLSKPTPDTPSPDGVECTSKIQLHPSILPPYLCNHLQPPVLQQARLSVSLPLWCLQLFSKDVFSEMTSRPITPILAPAGHSQWPPAHPEGHPLSRPWALRLGLL